MSGIKRTHKIGNPKIKEIQLNEFQKMVNTDIMECILDIDEFAVNGIFYLKGIENVLIVPGIFDITATQVTPGIETTVLTNIISFRCAERSFFVRLPEKGDYVNIKGINYNIISCEADGAGMINLILQRR